MNWLREMMSITIGALVLMGCSKKEEPAPLQMTSFQIDVGTTDVYLYNEGTGDRQIVGVAHRMPSSNLELWVVKEGTNVPIEQSYYVRRIAAIPGTNPSTVLTAIKDHLRIVHKMTRVDEHQITVAPNTSDPHPTTPGMSFGIWTASSGTPGQLFGVADLRQVAMKSYSELWVVPPGVYPLSDSFFARLLPPNTFSDPDPEAEMIQYLKDNDGQPLQTIRVESSE